MKSITLLQTAAGDLYTEMMRVTSIPNRLYCLTKSIDYRSYHGVKRGYFNWQATYNRIAMLDELLCERYDGWVMYLDADAYIRDPRFDIHRYLDDLPNGIAFVAAPAVKVRKWEINAGVFLINLGSTVGRSIVQEWRDLAGAHSPDRHLEVVSEPWGLLPNGDRLLNDQTFLHMIFRSTPDYLEALHIETSLLNYSHGSFISQLIRQDSLTNVQRLDLLRARCFEALANASAFMPVNLDVIANSAKTDKGTTEGNAHGYTRYYEFLFEQYRFAVFNALELGLLRGGPEAGGSPDRATPSIPSIAMWLEYFPFARLYGVDISDFKSVQGPRFQFYRVDLGDRNAVLTLAKKLPRMRFIVDDASHASFHQQLAFCAFFHCVEPGGYYVIEDCDWQPSLLQSSMPATRLTRDIFGEFTSVRRLDIPSAILGEISIDEITNQISDIYIHRKKSQDRSGGVAKLIVIRKKL
jgi:hypothetical protein